MTLIGGGVGSFVTSTYKAQESTRAINNEVIKLLTEKILEGRPVMLKAETSEENLNRVFQYKENAFLIRQITHYISDNYNTINFDSLNSALTSLERRYSYAQIYKYNGLATIICESITLHENQSGAPQDHIIINNSSKCPNDNMNGVLITLQKLDLNNQRARISFENDKNNVVCRRKTDCEFWVDVGDRLESTPYKTLVLIEYIGMNEAYSGTDPIVTFSIVLRSDQL